MQWSSCSHHSATQLTYWLSTSAQAVHLLTQWIQTRSLQTVVASQYLLRSSADKRAWLQQMIQLSVNSGEVRVAVYSLYEVVVTAMLLDNRCSSLRVLTYCLMTVLTHTHTYIHTQSCVSSGDIVSPLVVCVSSLVVCVCVCVFVGLTFGDFFWVYTPTSGDSPRIGTVPRSSRIGKNLYLASFW